MLFKPADIQNLNDQIENWDMMNKAEVKGQIDQLGIKRYTYSQNPIPLARAFRSRLRKKFLLIDKISYSMPRSAVFLHKGVSRGHGKNNPRQAKEWFQPVVDKNIEALADIVSDGQGDLVVNALKIK